MTGLRRGLMLVVLVVLTALMLPSTASQRRTQGDDPPSDRTSPGRMVHVTGKGFGANETVNLRFGSHPWDTATTDPTGSFRISVHVFGTALPGEHRIKAQERLRGVRHHYVPGQHQLVAVSGRPPHHGQNRHENVLSTATMSIARLWSFPTDYLVTSSPAVANGVVYITGCAPVCARCSNRSRAVVQQGWLHRLLPGRSEGRVYVGNALGDVYSLDAVTGAERWSSSVGDPTSHRSHLSDRGGWSGVRRGVGDAYTRWTPLRGPRMVVRRRAVRCVFPGRCEREVYFGSRNCNVYALDAVTGAERWWFRDRQPAYSSPAVANEVVYVGSGDHSVYALDAASGAERWAFRTGGYVYSSPAVANGVVYVGVGRNVYALDAVTGAKRWSFHSELDSRLLPGRSERGGLRGWRPFFVCARRGHWGRAVVVPDGPEG